MNVLRFGAKHVYFTYINNVLLSHNVMYAGNVKASTLRRPLLFGWSGFYFSIKTSFFPHSVFLYLPLNFVRCVHTTGTAMCIVLETAAQLIAGALAIFLRIWILHLSAGKNKVWPKHTSKRCSRNIQIKFLQNSWISFRWHSFFTHIHSHCVAEWIYVYVNEMKINDDECISQQWHTVSTQDDVCSFV